jgi:actin-like ATPase involved in cell morphogenesis
MLPREEQKKTDPVNMRLFLNAQEIINISRQRLCNKAELTTNQIWRQVVEELRKIEPELANACVPQCYYRGFCPEFKSCGFADGELFPLKVTDYHNKL